MKRLINIIIFLCVFITANLLFGLPKKNLVDHTVKPEKGAQRKAFERALQKAQPDVILLGNSMLSNSVNSRFFSQITKTRTLKLCRGGSASAWWYLCTKNVICKAQHKPKFLVLFFRDNYLTRPNHRVKDSYFLSINDMANEDEPLLDSLAYLNCSPLQYACMKYSTIFQKKQKLRNNILDYLKNDAVGSIVSLEKEQTRESLENIFNNNNFDTELLTLRHNKITSSFSTHQYDFTSSVKKSFLPEIVKLTKENDIKLILVRVKRRRDLKPNTEPELLTKYICDLRDYANSNNVDLIDFTHDTNLKLEHYADGDHLNRDKGMPLFTQLLAAKIISSFRTHNFITAY